MGYKAFDQKEIEPLFPFGHGLTYSEFQLEDMKVHPNSDCVAVRATLVNSGDVDASQVVQILTMDMTLQKMCMEI